MPISSRRPSWRSTSSHSTSSRKSDPDWAYQIELVPAQHIDADQLRQFLVLLAREQKQDASKIRIEAGFSIRKGVSNLTFAETAGLVGDIGSSSAQ